MTTASGDQPHTSEPDRGFRIDAKLSPESRRYLIHIRVQSLDLDKNTPVPIICEKSVPARGFSLRGLGSRYERTQEYSCPPSNILTNGACIFDRGTSCILVLFIEANIPREDDISYYLGVVAAPGALRFL